MQSPFLLPQFTIACYGNFIMKRLYCISLIVSMHWEMMVVAGSLKSYRARRDFSQTSEPKGRHSGSRSGGRAFVIHKHDASHLHYDVRLSVGGVLKSWALPKAPSSNPRIKRLAVQTEDHPLSYGRFEGVIPEGSYGAGTVMIWDRGTYTNIKTKNDKKVSMQECIKQGIIEIVIHGEKLQGAYALIRTHLRDNNNWLLIKMNDEYAHTAYTNTTRSALTGRTMAQIRRDEKNLISQRSATKRSV